MASRASHHEVEPDYFLHDPAFLTHFRDYFCRPVRSPAAAELAVTSGARRSRRPKGPGPSSTRGAAQPVASPAAC
ncbi:hypothetical protein ACIQF5_27995 [Streptomyces goshikiensis]|uniref:hypothetical protein n=1 Tax=Streptomyces goshikiensis TaxID=1942 RepID=UPI003820E68D